MFGSLKIGKIAGIEIKVHALFLLMILFFALQGFSAGGGAGALISVFHIGALFALVVLHELGHSLVAIRLGYRVRDITLLPFGGAARMESMPRQPSHEILVALAGPAVNIALMLLSAPLIVLTLPLMETAPLWPSLVMWLFMANLILAAFNLIPAFPMDGGRVLRAWLSRKRGTLEGTRLAAKVGRAFAVIMAIAGIVFPSAIMLVFIALFVWLAGRAEEREVMARYTPPSGIAGFDGHPVMLFKHVPFDMRR